MATLRRPCIPALKPSKSPPSPNAAPHFFSLSEVVNDMLQWCSNCQTDSLVLTDKHDLSICRECGCETEATRPADLPITAALLAAIDLESGLARVPGEFAEAKSISGEVPEVPLTTARFLPASYFEEEARVAELAAQLNENWADDQLLERIVRLEQTLVIADNVHQALNEATRVNQAKQSSEPAKQPNDTPNAQPLADDGSSVVKPKPATPRPAAADRKRATPLVRIDTGHVATPDQIRAHQEKMNRGIAREPRDVDFGSASHTANSSAVATAVREPDRPQWRVDAGHLSELPIARPISSPDPNSANQRGDASPLFRDGLPVSFAASMAGWSNEAKQITGLGLATAWMVQLIIGVMLLSSGPLTLWSIWLVAETVGTVCLAAFAWQIFLPNRRPERSNMESGFRPLGPNLRERHPAARENISG